MVDAPQERSFELCFCVCFFLYVIQYAVSRIIQIVRNPPYGPGLLNEPVQEYKK